MTRAFVAVALIVGAATTPFTVAGIDLGRPHVNANGRAAQGRRFGRGQPVFPNPDYDGRFTFVRLRYGPPVAEVYQSIPWSHDYPAGERNFMRMLNEVTYLRPKTDETVNRECE